MFDFRLPNFEFQNPWLLLLFLLLLPLIFRDVRTRKKAGIRVPSTRGMEASAGIAAVLSLLRLFKYAILSAMILAIARPRTFTISQNFDETKGIDIMLAVDVSYSMLARDLEPDRLDALKVIAAKFVDNRPTDRLGLVAYSGEAFLKVPLTTDREILKAEIKHLNPNELQPGTAIGEGLAVAVNHLRTSKAKSKVIILMTDGVNTVQNSLEPAQAAALAQNNNIKVYTIGIGTNGYALMPTSIDFFGDLQFSEAKVEIDEVALQGVANQTGGRYFRATTNKSLQGIYEEIDTLEKSEVKAERLYNYTELYHPLLWLAVGLLLIDALLRWRIFKILS